MIFLRYDWFSRFETLSDSSSRSSFFDYIEYFDVRLIFKYWDFAKITRLPYSYKHRFTPKPASWVFGQEQLMPFPHDIMFGRWAGRVPNVANSPSRPPTFDFHSVKNSNEILTTASARSFCTPIAHFSAVEYDVVVLLNILSMQWMARFVTFSVTSYTLAGCLYIRAHGIQSM